MSVASKTKTKRFITVVLSFVAVLIVLPTWADTTQGIISIPTVSSVVSTSQYQSNQDLSQLRKRLTERFSGIVTEVRSLVNTTTNIPFSDGTAFRTIDVSQGIGVKPMVSRQDFFSDIVDDPYEIYINRLAANGVLTISQKFFPQNYFRTDDFMSLLAKLYKNPIPQDVLRILSSDDILTKGMLQQVMTLPGVESAYVDGNPYDNLIRSEGAYYLVRMFDVPALETNQKDSIAGGNAFNDIEGNLHADDINLLASLGILNTQSDKFYPNNYLRHYDFVILFVNTLLVAKQQLLPSHPQGTYFADVDDTAPYIAQLIYAADRGLIDHLIISKRGQLYFEPNDFITQDDVYHTLSAPAGVVFIHDDEQAEQTKISRGELANLLVQSFQLQAKKPSSDIVSGNVLSTGDMSVLLKLKTLLSMF